MTNDLRKQAEAKLALSPEPLAATSPAETQRLLHELRVHQIELELQNEELRLAQAEIEAGPRPRSKPGARAISTSTTWLRWATAPCPSRD